MAEEIYPLGGRAGETLGLELRGGTLGGREDRRGHVESPVRNRLAPATDHRRDAGLDLDRRRTPISTSSRWPRWSSRRIPRCESPPIRRLRRSRAVAPVVFNGRIDPPGDEDRFALAVTPGQRVRIKVQAYEHRLGTRRRASRAWQRRRGDWPTPTTPVLHPAAQERAAAVLIVSPTRRSSSPYRAARTRSRW